MKILWLCNIMIPAIAEEFGLPYSNREGWLTGIYERVYADAKEGKEAQGRDWHLLSYGRNTGLYCGQMLWEGRVSAAPNRGSLLCVPGGAVFAGKV